MSKKIIISTFLVAVSAIAVAQNKKVVRDSVQLDEVVVTALKVQTPWRETAKQVQIISREEIKKSAGKDLSQLLQEQSGLVVNNAHANPAENKSVYLRGAANEFTLILIDGVPVNDPSGVGGAFDLRLIPLEHIERIEILKGSQSTLYGTDAIAGVINVITHREFSKPFSAYGGVSYGSLNTLKLNAGVRGNAGIANYNISMLRNSTDGISSAVDNVDSLAFDKDGFLQKGVQANVDFNLTDNFKLSPYFRYENFEGDYDASAFTDAPNELEMKLINTGARAEWTLGKALTRLSYNFTAADREFRSAFGVSPFNGKLHNAEAYVSVPLSRYVQVIGGVNFQRYKMLDSAAVPKDPRFNIVSPYATFILKGLEGFYLETGYRINSHSEYGTNSTYNISPAYWVANRLKIFASFSTGFKAPTLSQLYGPFGGNDKLKPQVSQSTEIGLNYISRGNETDAQVTYYRRKIDDLIDYTFDPGYFNRDSQEDQGVEILVKQKVSEKISLAATYDFVTGKSYTISESGQDTSFYNLVKKPKSKASLSLNYQPVERMNLSLFGLYMGKRTDIFFNPDTFLGEQVQLDPYFLVNAYADYSFFDRKMLVFIDVKNILDEDFTETYGYNTIGFNAQVGLRFEL